MREIKFRAWDKRRKIMLVNHAFDSIAKCELYGKSDLIWMQYTGLKSNNGKEIYEGDILKRSNRITKFVFVVDFSYGSFSGVTEPGRNHRLTLERAMNLEGAEYDEIIGNIYENPELLEVK